MGLKYKIKQLKISFADSKKEYSHGPKKNHFAFDSQQETINLSIKS